jgi:hypothetical protein
MDGPGIAQWASHLVPIEWRTMQRLCIGLLCLAEFETPLSSKYHFHFDVALSTGLLKLCKYLYTLFTYIRTFLNF